MTEKPNEFKLACTYRHDKGHKMVSRAEKLIRHAPCNLALDRSIARTRRGFSNEVV